MSTCTWTQDDEGGPWFAGCNRWYFDFEEGGPVENGFRFCPHCGGEMRSVPYEWEEDDDTTS